jgi:hypothetical protein
VIRTLLNPIHKRFFIIYLSEIATTVWSLMSPNPVLLNIAHLNTRNFLLPNPVLALNCLCSFSPDSFKIC